ncbi:MAG: protein adenylyltransferase SelO family protein, partial [Methylococcales bacterium]|nr:protein adenylyltransferase SelO family protein [Methylococcales bacterium]
DMFYDGNPQHEQGAIVCRVAPSFTRFGHFQIFAARDDLTLLKQFVDFTIRTDFPELGEPSTAVYLKWFAEVCRRTADMIVHWQRVGFVHGVMNTDNMSILGLTIDYGPYGWLENFDLDWTPNTTDADIGRYRFGKQARMASWNLAQLANAIIPLIQQIKPLQAILDEHYIQNFQTAWSKMMAEKLGLPDSQETDEALIYDLVALLQTVETDMTLFFRQLAKVDMSQIEFDISPLEDVYYSPEQLDETYENSRLEWLKRYQQRLHQSEITEAERCKRMNATNPIYVPRNYLVQLAIDAAEQGDFSEIHKLLDVFRSPYDEKPHLKKYAQKRPDWAKERAGCSMLSCSS